MKIPTRCGKSVIPFFTNVRNHGHILPWSFLSPYIYLHAFCHRNLLSISGNLTNDNLNVALNANRTKQILTSHPEVKKLMGHDPMTKWKLFIYYGVQFASLEILMGAPWYIWAFCCCTICATMNNSLPLAFHEISHNLGAKKMWHNRVLAIIANLPMAIPAASTFRRYHIEHHKFQGEHIVDVDIPSDLEGRVFRPNLLSKAVWMFFQPAWYSLRPLVMNPKNVTMWELINYIASIAFDLAIYSRYGISGVVYLALGSLAGMQFHPIAGHFIAEHFIFHDGQETYSYYGPLNWLTFHVGYHNEHHDFPFVTGKNLHKLRAIAPEYYDTLPHYHSWTKVLIDFLLDEKLSPFSRVKRATMLDSEVKALQVKGGLVPR